MPLPSSTLFTANVVAPVPPFATGNVPVTPAVKGNPVKLVATPDAGVPKAGVTKVGLIDITTLPVPVSSEITPANSEDVVAESTFNLSVVTTNVFDAGIVLPFMLVAVATPKTGVTRVGEINVLLVNV